MIVVATLGWMAATNEAAPRRMELLTTALTDLGYEVTEAYPGARSWQRCGRRSAQYVWKTESLEGEACVYGDGVKVLYVRPQR